MDGSHDRGIRARRESEKTTAQFGDWQPLRVKLVDDEEAPIQGRVACFGTPLDKTNPFTQEVHTDAGGIADFGRLPPGQYTLTAHVDNTNEWNGGIGHFLGPGRPGELIVRCPTRFDARVPAKFQITPPEDFAVGPALFRGHVVAARPDVRRQILDIKR